MLSVTRTPAAISRLSGNASYVTHDVRLRVGRRAQVEDDAALDERRDARGILDRVRPVRDPLRADRQRPQDLRPAAPFAGVDGDVEPDGPGELDRLAVDLGVREARLRPGEVDRDEALRDACCLEAADEREVSLGRDASA